MYKNLETERLFIRPIKTTDAQFIIELLNSEGWLQFIGDRNIKTILDAEAYIQSAIDNKNFFYHVFELKETKQAIGIITFLYRTNQQSPDIGFAMLPTFENKGYAFEATKKYLTEIMKDSKDDKIIAITLPENKSSINLIKKLGLNYSNNIEENAETLHVYSIKLK